jgi:hypothetical protein
MNFPTTSVPALIVHWATMNIPSDPTSMAGLLMGIQNACQMALNFQPSSGAMRLASTLPPDVLSHPMPYPDRISYAGKLIQIAWDEWSENHRNLIRRFLQMVDDGEILESDFSDVEAAEKLFEVHSG